MIKSIQDPAVLQLQAALGKFAALVVSNDYLIGKLSPEESEGWAVRVKSDDGITSYRFDRDSDISKSLGSMSLPMRVENSRCYHRNGSTIRPTMVIHIDFSDKLLKCPEFCAKLLKTIVCFREEKLKYNTYADDSWSKMFVIPVPPECRYK